MRSKIARIVLLGALAAGICSCGKPDPRTAPVKSASPSAFARWRTMASDGIRVEEWREFDSLLQELRMRVTAEKRASGSEAVEAAMRAGIDGRTFQEVLLLGYEARLRRVIPERGEVELAMSENIRRARREKSATTAGDIERMRERQDKRLRELDAEIAQARKRTSELRAALGLAEPAAPDVPPRKL
jgi:hypothetical protein